MRNYHKNPVKTLKDIQEFIVFYLPNQYLATGLMKIKIDKFFYIRCLKCNYYCWKRTNQIKSKKGCYNCRKIKPKVLKEVKPKVLKEVKPKLIKESKPKLIKEVKPKPPTTIEEAKIYVETFFPNVYEVLGISFHNKRNYIKLKCLNCGFEKSSVLCDIRNKIGCIKCFHKTQLDTKEQILEKLYLVYGNKYSYELNDGVRYKDQITIFCNICQNYFQVRSIEKHLHNFVECPKCKGNKSKGEKNIIEFLQSYKIKYYNEYSFEDCIFPITNRRLRFDFYLPDYNILIEYNGEQHYKYVNHFHKTKNDYEDTCNRDVFKIEYCIFKDIKLISINCRIYKNKKAFFDLLKEQLKPDERLNLCKPF